MRITRSAQQITAPGSSVSNQQRTLSSAKSGLVVKPKSTSSSRVSSSQLQQKPTKRRKVGPAGEGVEVRAELEDAIPSSSFSSHPSGSLQSPSSASTLLVDENQISQYTTLPLPSLPFSLKEAREHLVSQDVRFEKLFQQIELKTYQELENGEVKELNIFRSLVTSILGQQISWLAARSICFKFSRVFFPFLPEKPDFEKFPRESLPFPTPHACLRASEQELRSAGLSGAKFKYVLDISRRFAEGKLDVRRLILLPEEELIKELVQIKGVGVWTAQMFLMFALRSPNVMPTGDLGIQRGMCIFFSSDKNGPKITERKKKTGSAGEEDPELFSPFSLSAPAREIPSLPEGAPSLALIKSRLSGKKAKGNVYLTPSEMEILSGAWAPYRSIACLLMWPLVD